VFWKHKSKARARKPRLSPETITLIKEMAANNRLWGAERICGELLKLDIRVSKRTIQKYMRHVRAISSGWTELENVLVQSCGRDMGLRFFAGDRSLLPSAFCVLPRRAEVAEGDPCECDTHSDRSLGGATAAGSDSVWANTHLARDPSDVLSHIETFMAESWEDYLRQLEHMTNADHAIENHARTFHQGSAPPTVTLLIAEHPNWQGVPERVG
jgi:Transmembrane secretion effector